MSDRRRRLVALAALLATTAAWLPAVHLCYRPPPQRVEAPLLVERHLALWRDPASRAREIERMRATNAEWDFMGRSFVAWSLANLALADPARRDEALAAMDRIIDETLAIERERGPYTFLMGYARAGEFKVGPPRSQFLDGEIALMLGLRCLVADRADYRALLRERVAVMVARMQKSPVLSAESYPDECWTFCNAVALAAIRVADVLDGSDHSALLAAWVATAKRKLTDPATGLLVSSYTVDGQVRDGPEGSSIWMAAHCLAIVDEPFAREQYARARAALGAEALGFGWAREWPRGWQGPHDVDSGPVVPIVEASPGSSGLALLGAATFGDDAYLAELRTTLRFAAFPVEERGALRYAAGNQVGDAVILYAALSGPAWRAVRERAR